MILVADESVDQPIIVGLRTLGYEVLAISEVAPRSTDDGVLARARALNAVLVTSDKDFGELVFRQQLHASGVLLLRLSGLGRQAKIDAVLSAVREHGPGMIGKFAVLSPGHLRVRDA